MIIKNIIDAMCRQFAYNLNRGPKLLGFTLIKRSGVPKPRKTDKNTKMKLNRMRKITSLNVFWSDLKTTHRHRPVVSKYFKKSKF
jgi:hypothetical protein